MATVLPPITIADDRQLAHEATAADIPAIGLPDAPPAALLWSRALTAASVVVFLFTLDQLTVLLADYWLLGSLGFKSIFWTNFRMGATLYVVAFLSFALAVMLPSRLHPVSEFARQNTTKLAFLVASLAAYFLAMRYLQFLLGGFGLTFGERDPVFGIDVGFYVFNLPNIWIGWQYALAAASLMLIVSLACASTLPREPATAESRMARLTRFVRALSTPPTRFSVGLIGLLAAFGVWLTRFDLLLKDNRESSIRTGAEYIDVRGFFSTLNYINITTIVVLGITIAVVLLLRTLHRDGVSESSRPRYRKLAYALLVLTLLDFAFKVMVELRDLVAVKPNEPVIQLAYIRRHVSATRRAFGLENVKEIEFRPNGSEDPVPSAASLLASPTLKNAPLWPGFVSYLERYLDFQHSRRVLQTGGDTMVYGPTLEVFRQQQKLRTYYNFLNIDSVRYEIGGDKRMLVSAVRELPLMEPVPWLAYWGQRFMLFTHGFGLVMAPASEATAKGEPQYVSHQIPTEVAWPEIATPNPRVYYGEGAATMAFSNVDRMMELDYPTDQDRAQIVLPANVPSGVPVDSVIKRLVFGWRSGMFFDLVFSDLIKETTRIHFYRTPVERLRRVAPFLFYDSNPYAVAADGRIVWLVNGMTWTNRYPYSWPGELGDKSDERSPFPQEEKIVNYVEDSVKATVDAFTGQVRFYKIADQPVVNAWAKVYPDLFTPAAQMPAPIRKQLTYPSQLFHIQFDDHYIYYHMNDPMYFFNMEDMWDDGDEVLGPVMDHGRAITFSMEPYNCLLETGGALPPSAERTQFALAMAFTPEKALNLRAIPIAYQDGADYGKLFVLVIPKGKFVPGPEQADAAIDQDPRIAQNFAWWNRRGLEVVRGHTTLLPIGREILYVEPIFLRSQQNPVTQLKKVIVVFRGKPFMADTLDQAVQAAVSEGTSDSNTPLKLESL